MIPRTFPSLVSAAGTYMRVNFLASVTGLTRWIDYIPVKTVAYSTTAAETTNSGGHLTVMAIESTTVFTKWVDYIPVYEDAAATVAWGTGSNGYLPVCQALSLDFTAGVLDSRITFTRADATSCATYFDSTGRLQTAAANVARFDYDPATLLPRGLLIEESRTNLLLQSRDMTQAAWSKTDVTPTRNQVGIDGTANSACLMTEGSAGTAQTVQSNGTVTAGAAITGSVVAKKSGNNFILVLVSETTATDGSYAMFDLNTGAASSTTNVGAATASSASITNLGGGWYRCSVTCTPNGTYTVPRLLIRSATSLANNARVSGATYIVDAAQLEVGAFATSIITTTASTVTRAADSASMTGTNFSSWWNSASGTVVAEFSGGTANRPVYRVGTTGIGSVGPVPSSPNVLIDKAGTGTLVTSSGYLSTTNKHAMAYDSTTIYGCLNGGTVGTSATVMTTSDRLFIGINLDATNPLNGYVRRLTYYPTRLPNATLQALTA